MKNFLLIFFCAIFLISFSQCRNSKQMPYLLQNDIPFTIKKATYKTWVAGIKGGGSGVDVFFTIDSFNTGVISLDSLYFRNKKKKIEKNDTLYIARFITETNQQKDIILHQNPQQEYGNTPPKILEKFPFELNDDECVIRFTEKGRIKYFKLRLKKENGVFYP